MAEGDNGLVKPPTVSSAYDEAMDALSSLITKRTRADNNNKGDRFDLLFDYVKILDLEESIAKMKVIHVAGTKGKGSTCTFTEAILRNCGFHTGLFTSPHLIDVRERFRLDGVDISEEKFLAYFWWCWDRLKEEVNRIFLPGAPRVHPQVSFLSECTRHLIGLGFKLEKTSDDIPMPTYFRFLALLAFKTFAAEEVDVAIIEVGLGGRFDATNVVQTPVVCGISSLGYDHVEILGHTLGAIAGEKAGIFKKGVPAFTVPQPDEAMHVLEEKASQLDVPLKVAAPLDSNLLNGLHLGLEGDHQYLNAGLAITLCSTWLQKTGHIEFNYLEHTSSLPEQFIKGLTTATFQGRAQIIPDKFLDTESPGDLVFYMDGAHSPESMEVCGKWFSFAIKDHKQQQSLTSQEQENYEASHEIRQGYLREPSRKKSAQILLFNCMTVRDPQLLLPRLMKTCASHGVHFKKALFVPSTSVYYKVGSTVLPPADPQVNLSWQLTLQRVWENLICAEKGTAKNQGFASGDNKNDREERGKSCENSVVFPSLPLAIKWLRDAVKQDKTVRFQVLVTGSLHLVGDVMRLVKK